MSSTAVIGRDEELAQLDALRRRAESGRGAVVLVRGEAGVGKSRLLAELVARSRHAGACVLVGRAVEGGGAFRPLSDALLAQQRRGALPTSGAVGPLAGALARLVPGWAPAMELGEGTDLPLLVSEGVLRLLGLLDGTPGVLVLDDLHWADADSLTVLDRLVDAVSEAPVLIVLASRDPVEVLLDRIAARADLVLDLRRLDPAGTAALALACAEQAALPEPVTGHLVEHAEGLPFLVEELLTGLVDSGALVRTAAGWEHRGELSGAVPSSFASVVNARLASMPADVTTVVETAGVLGRSFDWRLLGRLTGQPDSGVLEALRVAVERGLLAYDGQGLDAFRFVHALTRETVLGRLLPPQRARIARDAAEIVDESADPLLAATLHAQAGAGGRAARLLLRAASRAVGAVGTQEQLLRRAVQLAPDDAEVGLALVDVLAWAGRAAEAREAGDRLLARPDLDHTRRSSLALVLARACLVADRPDQATSYLEEAAEGAPTDALAAHVAFALGDPDRAEALARRAAEAVDPAVRCEAWELLGRVARLRDRPEDAETAFGVALRTAEAAALPAWRVRAMHELGTLDLLGPARADRLLAARRDAEAAGMLGTAAVLDVQVMAVHALRMDHSATLRTAESGIALAERLRLPVLAGIGWIFAATARGHTGEYDQMHASLDEAESRLAESPTSSVPRASYVALRPWSSTISPRGSGHCGRGRLCCAARGPHHLRRTGGCWRWSRRRWTTALLTGWTSVRPEPRCRPPTAARWRTRTQWSPVARRESGGAPGRRRGSDVAAGLASPPHAPDRRAGRSAGRLG
jgi:tetratricopeptide (TPR) repeat protein